MLAGVVVEVVGASVVTTVVEDEVGGGEVMGTRTSTCFSVTRIGICFLTSELDLSEDDADSESVLFGFLAK